MVHIDYRHLNPDTLDNVLREIVLREGTEYGECEIPTDVKVETLRQTLTSGKAVIVYYAAHDFFDVAAKENQNA